MFGLEEAGENVGTVGLTSIREDHKTAEYSILIGPEYQGRGYATKALKCLLDYGFKELKLACIWGEIFDTNPAGLYIADKLGFHREGLLRSRYEKNGERIDTIMVSILRNEWKS